MVLFRLGVLVYFTPNEIKDNMNFKFKKSNKVELPLPVLQLSSEQALYSGRSNIFYSST